jgi:hypothetical protein
MNNNHPKPILFIFLGLLLLLNWTSIPDKIAINYLDAALATSATAYVAARGINATISVIQDIELSAGVISGSPGELLDPINDLIERFSSVMLFATASLLIQKIFLEISGWSILQVLLLFSLVLFIAHYLYKDEKPFLSATSLNLSYKALIFLLALRLCVPFMAVASSIVENIFLHEKINADISELQQAQADTAALSKLEKPPKTQIETQTSKTFEEPSIMGFITQKTQSVVKSVSSTLEDINLKKAYEKRIADLEQSLTNSIARIMNLVALFIIQSILLPVLFLYFIMAGVKALYRYDFVKAVDNAESSL